MFSRQAERLRRKRWVDANELAEEIYAILGNAELPLFHNGPLTLFMPASGQPPLTLDGARDGDTVIRYANRNDDGEEEVSDVTLSDGVIQNPGVTEDVAPDAPGLEEAEAEEPGQVSYGKISSGSGRIWSVDLLAGQSGLVDATCLNATDETDIPLETEVIVYRIADQYYFQVPLWL